MRKNKREEPCAPCSAQSPEDMGFFDAHTCEAAAAPRLDIAALRERLEAWEAQGGQRLNDVPCAQLRILLDVYEAAEKAALECARPVTVWAAGRAPKGTMARASTSVPCGICPACALRLVLHKEPQR
jgi:hypothetical protein